MIRGQTPTDTTTLTTQEGLEKDYRLNPNGGKDNTSTASFAFDVKRNCKGHQPSEKCYHGLDGESPSFNLQRRQGHGSTCQIYETKCRNGCNIVIKKINDYRPKPLIENEIKYLELACKNQHPNIIEYFGYYISDGVYHLAFEPGNQDLNTYLYTHKKRMNVAHFHNITFQILEMLSYLTKKKIKHGEMYGTNMVYFPKNDQIKLIDFGNAGDKASPDDWTDLEMTVITFYNYQYEIGRNSINRSSEGLALCHHTSFNSILNDGTHWLKGLAEPARQALLFHHKLFLSGRYVGYSTYDPPEVFSYLDYRGSRGQTEDAQKILSSRSDLLPRQALHELD